MTNKIDVALQQLNKTYGNGSIGWLDDFRESMKIEAIPTGSLGLDIALQCGGLPKGRLAEVFGGESSGKTTLALHIIANVQKAGGRAAAFIDAEHALDPAYCKALGVDLKKLVLSQPDTAEQALDTTEVLVRTGEFDIVVVDSVAGLVPRVEMEGDIGDAQVGVKARLMSKACRKLVEPAKTNKTAVLFINQIRSQIGGFAGTTTPGGWGLKFGASVRIKLNHTVGGKLKEGDEDSARRVQATVVKSKVGAPFRTAEFDVVYGMGIQRERDVLLQGFKFGVLSRGGAWYSFGDANLGQGLAKSVEFLVENPAVTAEIEKEVRKKALLA